MNILFSNLSSSRKMRPMCISDNLCRYDSMSRSEQRPKSIRKLSYKTALWKLAWFHMIAYDCISYHTILHDSILIPYDFNIWSRSSYSWYRSLNSLWPGSKRPSQGTTFQAHWPTPLHCDGRRNPNSPGKACHPHRASIPKTNMEFIQALKS